MSDDLAAWLRSQVDDDETLAESDYDIMISARKVRDAATEIARLRAELATAKRVAKLEGLLGLADSWITAALECKEWRWDADQHEAATHTRDEIREALGGRS